MNVSRLEQLLRLSQYDEVKTEFLVDGFSKGFDLGYVNENTEIQQTAPNLKFTIGNKTILWNKVMKEVQAGRYAGPFERIPFKNYIQSPIGLVPKDGGKKTRLIFHLSYPKNSTTSVNANIPAENSKVKYKDFDEAIRLCLQELEGLDSNLATIYFGKSDMSNAFRNLPMKKQFWKFLVMKAQSPFNGKFYFFVDKCMPFGAASSCKIFQEFSDAIAFLVKFQMKKENVNYLDDFLFLALMAGFCNQQLRKFLQICAEINFPVSLEKTEWASEIVTFLGLDLDGKKKLIRIPVEKVNRALVLVQKIINRPSKKSTLLELQSLCGFLNFLCKAIVPGRTFVRRMYLQGSHLTKPHHHFKIKEEFRQDLLIWEQFLKNELIFSRPFFDCRKNIHYTPQKFFTDASSTIGCGGVCDQDWFIMEWEEEIEDFFMEKAKPSINFLELYALTIGILSWVHQFQNSYVTLFCDNQSVIHMVNNQSAKNVNCMALIRLIVLHCMQYNVKIKIEYIESKANIYADLLSRSRYGEFRKIAKKRGDKFNNKPVKIPECLYPLSKFWIYDKE